jgi:hypothetical protein
VVHGWVPRLALGAGFLASIYGIYSLGTLATELSRPVKGLLVGLAIGSAEAIAGAYKDGSIEGFHLRKFFKSPTFGALGGLIASGHTGNVLSLLLASIGSMRMLLELVFKMVVPSYVPGKFASMTGPFVTWSERRGLFLIPYTLTWALYLGLATHVDWAPKNVMAAGLTATADHVHQTVRDQSQACGAPSVPTVERRYIVRGRVRPLLFWTGQHRAGEAHFVAGGAADARQLALLVGTDLDRAPMAMNRWSYLAESSCGGRARQVVLTNDSPDYWLQDRKTAPAVLAAWFDGVEEPSRPQLVRPMNLTFKELDALPASSHPLMMSGLPASHGERGFLAALVDVLQEAVATKGSGTALRRSYVYADTPYMLTAIASPASAGQDAAHSSAVLDVNVIIHDADQASVASFDLTVPTSGPDAGVPLRAVYRPNFWTELEFLLTPREGSR